MIHPLLSTKHRSSQFFAGAAVMLWWSWAFTVRGSGTPAPTDPPKELVVSGLYRFVRRPIYIGALIILLGHVLWHPSRSVLWMPLIFIGCSHLFFTLYEEPHLHRTFGAAYEQYYRAVPRWLPSLK